MIDLKTLYAEDTVAWAENQAAALRAAAQGGSNQQLDWENLAEEIEDLAKSQSRSLRSHIRNIIVHLIKLEYSPADRPHRKWRQSITNSRVEADDRIAESPSLKPRVEQIIAEEIERGARLAITALDARTELSRSLQQELKAKSYLDMFSYTPEQILGDWFPPEPDKP
ncbi:MAG TPA: DUF29 domain-containing protein [Stellaceae bacterium]|jgi:hypothetical protein|nr:DUF29 domain-containing protein [Stellaceae bacterium]